MNGFILDTDTWIEYFRHRGGVELLIIHLTVDNPSHNGVVDPQPKSVFVGTPHGLPHSFLILLLMDMTAFMAIDRRYGITNRTYGTAKNTAIITI